MERRYATLLPATPPFPITAYVPLPEFYREKSISRRPMVASACEECRIKKAKCDGHRPQCARCVNQGTHCKYVAHEGETRSLALKRRFQTLQEEAAQLRELYEFLHSKPPDDALEIFNRIRDSGDPLAVLELVKAAEQLLPVSGPAMFDSRQEKVNVQPPQCHSMKAASLDRIISPCRTRMLTLYPTCITDAHVYTRSICDENEA